MLQPDWLLALRAGDGAEMPDFVGARMVGLDLSELDFSGRDFSGADLSRCNLGGCNFFGAKMKGVTLFQAHAQRAEFCGADLRESNLEQLDAARAGFGNANLENANLKGCDLQGATLTRANLCGADLLGGKLQEARLRESNLRDTCLARADLSGADLGESDVSGANFEEAILREAHVRSIEGYKSARWIGADIRELDCSYAYGLRRFVGDQNFLDEFRRESPKFYWLWSISCDCGRSLTRWVLWTSIIAMVYAGLYAMSDVDYGAYESWFSPIYFSVVTMTTLGYGDALPASVLTQILAVSEACMGYVMLGGLLSILSQKMGRRSE